ncbi:hypothetical protein ABW636_14125 [Aquimarina sp. 2201CG1-2-11]|uniref:hypothetical protein n=1 Tax=Aquimarina discodermiae TaxID=3231043 RepID=UPI00346375A9
MKSNDTLLCHLVATDEMKKGVEPQYKHDEVVHNPNEIKVAVNEVVYLHFFHCGDADFNIEITTPTQILQFTPENTYKGCNNTIIRAIGTVKIKAQNQNFFVQLLRIHY